MTNDRSDSNPTTDETRAALANHKNVSSSSDVRLLGNRGTDSVHGTRCSEGEAGRHPASSAIGPRRTSSPLYPSRRLERIATQAREYPEMAFTTLAHHMDVPFLKRAFDRLNRKGAAGIDRVTWKSYAQDLYLNLRELHRKLVQREYEPQPVVRRWIPKSNGKLRPLGLPALEDKLVQRAVADLLESIYEQDFHEFSYGFRPGRNAHQALRDIRRGLSSGINYVIDCDISAFFDNLLHDELLLLLRKRMNDGRVLELIESWLKAGIMDNRELVFPEKGSPQGSVISPLLANVYLHEVLDTWFVEMVIPACRGKVVMYRYADDFVIGCATERDAKRIMKALPKRFANYGLEINADKTRMVSFRRPVRQSGSSDRSDRRPRKPGTFQFLGFTHYWGKTRNGRYVIKWKTDRRRQQRSIQAFWEWCRDHCHRPMENQHHTLCAKLRGHYQYYGIPFNTKSLSTVAFRVARAWRYWLNRRGGRKAFTWKKFYALLDVFPLPPPRLAHSLDEMG